MSRIALLPDHLISQIAAGEVIERPASVVKELVENSIDAGARRITVDLETGGRRLIRVRDDGSGLAPDDALLAFDRHATSKIRSFEDLLRVGSLGFRGEALASIAAVAKAELRTAEQSGEGRRVVVEGGRIRTDEPIAWPGGTQIEVRSLFFNVPARRNFLRAAATELRRSLEVLQGYALAHPEVGFEVAHQQRNVLRATPVGEAAADRLERIAQLFGVDLARELVPIPPEEAGVGGFVGKPGTATRRRRFLVVNGRLLRDRVLLATFYRAVREEWKSEDFPALFLYLEVPAEEIDVNVHPQKAEVRFRDPGLPSRVLAALRSALASARGTERAPLRGLQGDGRPALSWEGIGRLRNSSVGEGAAQAPWASAGGTATTGKLAEVSYERRDFDVTNTSPLSGHPTPSQSLRLVGQYKGSLVLLEGPAGLYLVDQHAAHERVLFEQLRAGWHGASTVSQALLEPMVLDLGAAEAMALGSIAELLTQLGFEIQGLSGASVGVTAAPAVLRIETVERLLLDLAESVSRRDDRPTLAELEELVLESFTASQACRSAIKIHRPLSRPEMEQLISDLFAAEQPYTCPHGRPTVLQMDDSELERRFGRR